MGSNLLRLMEMDYISVTPFTLFLYSPTIPRIPYASFVPSNLPRASITRCTLNVYHFLTVLQLLLVISAFHDKQRLDAAPFVTRRPFCPKRLKNFVFARLASFSLRGYWCKCKAFLKSLGAMVYYSAEIRTVDSQSDSRILLQL